MTALQTGCRNAGEVEDGSKGIPDAFKFGFGEYPFDRVLSEVDCRPM